MDTSLWSLVIGCFALSAIAGAGIFQALFVMPAYFSSPPASLEAMQKDKSFAFWIPLQLVALIALIVALIASEGGDQMTAIWVATALYVLCWVITGIFFIPGVVAFNKVDTTGAPSAELAAQGRRWMQRSWGRHVLTVSSAISLLVALAQ